MKKFVVTKLTAIFAAAVLAAMPFAAYVSAADASVTIPEGYYVKEVKDSSDELVKGELTVSIPDGVTGNYNVKAYEILRLVIPKNSNWHFGEASTPDPMTNTSDSKNIFLVTDAFAPMFAAAKAAYNADSTAGEALRNAATLYLTYDNNSKSLGISSTKPTCTKDENYVEIDNSAGNKIDRTYFEASIISKLTGSNANPTETEASAVRLFSDWASKFVRDSSVAENAEAVWNDSTKVYEFKNDNKLVYGYHLIVTTDASSNDNTPALNQNILNVPMAESVTLKAKAISIDKSVSNLIDANKKNNGSAAPDDTTTRYDDNSGTKYDKMTSNIGDINHYVVESHIPSYTSFDLDLAGSKNQLLPMSTELTEDNVNTATNEKYVYLFHDTMKNQDFIPTDVTTTTKYGKAVDGLRVKIKASGSLTEAVYKVKDFDTDGLLLVLNDSAAKDTAIGRLWETNYDSDSKKNFFAVNFDMKQLKALSLDGRDVEFSYNAELMGEAQTTGTDNTANLKYSNDPFNPATFATTTHTNKLYTYDVKLDKLFSDGATTDFYDDVSFKIYSDQAMTHSIQFTGNNGSYVRADSDDATTSDTLSVNNTEGTLLLRGLGEGTYYLAEQSNTNLTNAGYNILNPITVVIKAKDDDGTLVDSTDFKLFSGTETKSGATLDQVAVSVKSVSDDYGIEFEVINQKGFLLPLTGEMGNWFLAIAGIVLVAVGGTVIVLVNKKKKPSER